MKKAHLFAIACASALPVAAANAQYCDSHHGSYQSGSGYSSSHSRGYSSSYYRPSYPSPSRSYGSSHNSCGSDRIRLISGYQRGKGTRPSGWHDKSWFRKRGYNLDNYAHVHEHTGVVHYGRNLGSSSHRGHSGHDGHRGHSRHDDHSDHSGHRH